MKLEEITNMHTDEVSYTLTLNADELELLNIALPQSGAATFIYNWRQSDKEWYRKIKEALSKVVKENNDSLETL